ncbi:TetR/AcrR family transcriptional regulator [Phycicoccus sp. BSK3Z-2]|uniref:TetR/AcrR family transcriptional regulator n=1 Tax=Phycicoccus avicenniae TaxID=2828860 RepID=A0A941D841_9MICO|nr:TetR/AcrR family transcriptional regulator [Phycicoccus avicenniae]MBR7742575.1 TetR/AcrR family transcriptional regulator [Phycicoccus avicenniae]
MSPTRAEHRAAVERRILEVSRRHLVTDGPAALSLRAVARDLGMVSSAVYRYVASRDDLLTLLLVDAYTDLGDVVDAALADAADRPWDERVVVAAVAFHGWGHRDPSRYALLHGSPVPGYAAPPERTMQPGTRVPLALSRLVAEGVATGEVTEDGGPAVSDPGLAAELGRAADELGLDAGPGVVARALLLWAGVVGSTSLEVFGQYGPDAFARPGALVEHQVRVLLDVVRDRPGRTS